jgi:Zn-dependent protease/CBS domain-containing protein
MGGGWRIGRIAGTEVRVEPSLVLIAGLLVYSRWVELSSPVFPRTLPIVAFGLAIVGALMFFGSILLHELAHAAVARSRHIEVEGITLWMFGGATHARVDSRGPLDEFVIAVVGPGTSLAIGVGLLALARTMPFGPEWFVVHELGRLNILLAAFNVLPGFPLDGGRILRSVVWAATGSLTTATTVAARVGQVFGAAFIGLGVSLGLRRQDLGMVWLAIIGWMLLQAASATIAEQRRAKALADTPASALMRPPPVAIPANMAVGEARATYLEGRAGAFPVMDGGGVLGFVSADSTRDIAPERPVREVATGSAAVVVVGPSDPAGLVLDRLEDGRASIALVVSDDRLLGVIGQDDVADLLERGLPPVRA